MITVLSSLSCRRRIRCRHGEARGLAVYILVFMAHVDGSALWGHVAEVAGISWSLTIADAAAVAASLRHGDSSSGTQDAADLAPSMHWPAPIATRTSSSSAASPCHDEYVIERKELGRF